MTSLRSSCRLLGPVFCSAGLFLDPPLGGAWDGVFEVNKKPPNSTLQRVLVVPFFFWMLSPLMAILIDLKPFCCFQFFGGWFCRALFFFVDGLCFGWFCWVPLFLGGLEHVFSRCCSVRRFFLLVFYILIPSKNPVQRGILESTTHPPQLPNRCVLKRTLPKTRCGFKMFHVESLRKNKHFFRGALPSFRDAYMTMGQSPYRSEGPKGLQNSLITIGFGVFKIFQKAPHQNPWNRLFWISPPTGIIPTNVHWQVPINPEYGMEDEFPPLWVCCAEGHYGCAKAMGSLGEAGRAFWGFN